MDRPLQATIEMKGSALAMTLVLLVAGVSAVPLSGVAQPGDAIEASVDVVQSQSNAANESEATPPGARLSAVVGAQEAEVHGEIDSRAFDAALERADSADARARVVDQRVREIEQRLDGLAERKRELQREHKNGNITTGTYVAELTALTAQSESARGLANQSRVAARGLPSEVAQRQGINVTAIGELERRAANLTGPEVARIARSIAGPDVGRPVGAGPPDHAGPPNGSSVGPPDDGSTGPPDDPGNAANRSDGDAAEIEDVEAELERAEERVTAVEDRVGDVDADAANVDATALADAEAEIDEARADLDASRTALDDGDADDARRLIEEAEEHAERAEAHVDEATGDTEP